MGRKPLLIHKENSDFTVPGFARFTLAKRPKQVVLKDNFTLLVLPTRSKAGQNSKTDCNRSRKGKRMTKDRIKHYAYVKHITPKAEAM